MQAWHAAGPACVRVMWHSPQQQLQWQAVSRQHRLCAPGHICSGPWLVQVTPPPSSCKPSVALSWEPPLKLHATLREYLQGLADAVAIRREQVRRGGAQSHGAGLLQGQCREQKAPLKLHATLRHCRTWPTPWPSAGSRDANHCQQQT